MNHKGTGVYALRCKNSNRVYIGSSIDLQRREIEHISELKRDNHHCKELQKDFNILGRDSFYFEILEYVSDESILRERELFFIQQYNGPDLYNSITNKTTGYPDNIPIPVIQLSLTGEYIRFFSSIKEANLSIGRDPYWDGISSCCRGEAKTADNFIWVKYIENIESDIKNILSEKVKRSTVIEQIDLQSGELLNQFSSLSEAEVFFNKKIGNSTIYDTVNNKLKSSYGFYFRRYTFPKNRTPEYYLGIDVGKNGSCVLVSKNHIFKFVIPTIGNVYDIKRLVEWLGSWSGYIKHCVIEDVHAIFGSAAKSTFEFGFGAGLLEGCLVSLNIPYTKIQPKVWQKEMFQGIPEIRKPNTKGDKKGALETKQMALLAAKRIFPDVDLRATTRSKNPHDGIVDALLMAEYCRRKF